MILYTLRRILMIIPIALVVTVLIFTLMNIVPGDPARSLAGGEAVTEEQLNVIRERYGLNEPFLNRLGQYLYNVVFKGDFGYSYANGSSVGSELVARASTTFIIAVCGLTISILLGVPIGIRAAVRANTIEDRISMFLTNIGNSMPLFWLALLLILEFSLKRKWFPSFGSSTWKHYVLPSVCVALTGIAGIARQTRSSMLEVIRSDYVTTAWSKGLPERKVVYGHALPNALIPIITVCGNQFGRLIGGVVVVERVFSVRGLSVYMLDGINLRDYPVVQGSLIVITLMFCVIMLIADLIYTFVDPRIKAQYMRKIKKGGSKNAKATA